MQTVRGEKKIGLTFDVVNIGGGEVYREGKADMCDHNDRDVKNKVYVNVASNLGQPSCFSDGTGNGEITLYGGKKTVTCELALESLGDFEQIFTIHLMYQYEDTIQTSFMVKPLDMARPAQTPEGASK